MRWQKFDEYETSFMSLYRRRIRFRQHVEFIQCLQTILNLVLNVY